MQCPLGDGELIYHITHGENKLPITYSTCPACRGFWMESFAANYIKTSAATVPVAHSDHAVAASTCPVCSEKLTRTTGENIPEYVRVYSCPRGHGYFFPAGQLSLFKKAQQSKIEYHKLWHIPLPGVASVLLTAFVMMILASGLITGLTALKEKQNTASQAKQFFSGAHAYIINATGSALFTVETSVPATVTLHIPRLSDTGKIMETGNSLLHQSTVQNIPAGTYSYFFTMQINGVQLVSDHYTFTMSH